MKFHENDARLPLELFLIRAAAGTETASERADLLAAWRQCLANGPSCPRRQIKKVLPPPPPAPFTSASAAVLPKHLQLLERCLEAER